MASEADEYPPSPVNESGEEDGDSQELKESQDEDNEPEEQDEQEDLEDQDQSQEEQSQEEQSDDEPETKPTPINVQNNKVAELLKHLQSSGAIVKKPAIKTEPIVKEEPTVPEEFHCKTCDEEFECWSELEQHLIQHVSSPYVLLEKLPPSDDESEPDFEPGDDGWSDEEDVKPQPKKIDISDILKNPALAIKKAADKPVTQDSALNKLSSLGGFTIKKNNSTPTTPKKPDTDNNPDTSNDLMKKLGNLGGLKLKLKSEGLGKNFKVVNGEDKGTELKTESADEEDWNSEGEAGSEEGKSAEQSDQEEGPESKTEISQKNSSEATSPQKNTPIIIKRAVVQEPAKPIITKEIPSSKAMAFPQPTTLTDFTVKKELDTEADIKNPVPLFNQEIKSERTSPPPNDTIAPQITQIKTENDAPVTSANNQPLFSSQQQTELASQMPKPLPPVAKKENEITAIIEINGDSGDDDDDCCVVSATPAPDIKPNIVPKIETVSYPTPTYAPTTSLPSTTGPTILSSRLLTTQMPPTHHSTEKQHNFNWNAPDSKPAIDLLDKSADAIFESLLSAKKDNTLSLSDVSEYISLDRLGSQHTCEICNTRFTSLQMLENHKLTTGHSKSLAPLVPSSSALLPTYPSSSSLMNSLFPVKQLADQVGKLTSMGANSSPFTHQQNVMINIQAYPPGQMPGMGQQPYNSYAPGQTYQGQPPSNMYSHGMPGQPQPQPGQPYPGQFSQQQPYGQPSSMYQSAYPGSQNGFQSMGQPGQPAYSSASPLQGMQQAVYAQGANVPVSQQQLVSQQMIGPMGQGSMGPPGSGQSPSQLMAQNQMRPPPPPGGGIRIQNVQTFAPGQMPPPQGPGVRGQAPGARGMSPRARMPGVRGQRPTIRPGVQVHGQNIRGAKPGGPRMPIKRPGGPMPNTAANAQKRRMDMLLPGKHDNEDCTVMAMQKQRDGLPMIQSVQGAKEKFNLGSGISITKKTVNKEASAMANVLASRGISIKQKAKSRSPSPERPLPHIPNLGAGVSIKHSSKSSDFTIPEAKVGGGMHSCRVCKKMFMNQSSLMVHVASAHPQSKIPLFKCDECPASYPKSAQLQHHRRVFHNVAGPNRELGLPVVDLSQEDNLKRLANLGIYSFIPLANREEASGCFGIPVISVHNAQNGMTNSLQALGADGLLSLGPLKPLPNS